MTILTLPPHSTYKLQPLDVGVMGPFKAAYNAPIDSWMLRNPGKTFTIYQVAASVELAFLKAITPFNIVADFKKTGIFPYDRNVFTDIDFMCSSVTNRTFDVNNTCIKNHVSITSDFLTPCFIKCRPHYLYYYRYNNNAISANYRYKQTSY